MSFQPPPIPTTNNPREHNYPYYSAAGEIRAPYLGSVLPDGSWTGHPAFCVGGGSSLERFNFRALRGQRTIGVNVAFMGFEPTIIFSMDTRCLRWIMTGQYDHKFKADVKSRFIGARSYKCWLLTFAADLPPGVFHLRAKVEYHSALDHFARSIGEPLGTGNNSGFGALNLAYVLGAEPIYLLGYDMAIAPGGKSHWHAGHPFNLTQQTLDGFAGHFKRAALIARQDHRRIINLNPDSKLHDFEFGDAERVLGPCWRKL